MAGFCGRVLFVDLTSGKIKVQTLPEEIYRQFIGGAGLGARILFEHMKANGDPLGPENILGFMSGLLSGTSVPMASKFIVVCKSPLTETWGDANSGGRFGQELKAAGYDAVIFQGVSPKPVYLWIHDGDAELKDAAYLWGKETFETEAAIIAELGDKRIKVAKIGPSGELCSRMAVVVGDEGRVAARSGVGAAMGSKRLKAVAVRGRGQVGIADAKRFSELRQETLRHLREDNLAFIKMLANGGTAQSPFLVMPIGMAPVKNWTLSGEAAFPDYAKIAGDSILKYTLKKNSCGNCPIVCGHILSVTKGPYAMQGRRPEYETIAAFGLMCMNASAESIIKANDICDRFGIDTISAGTTIAFAMECYEKGIISKKETDGIELTWGNAEAIIAMLNKIVRREGFGEILADGTARAAKQIGRGAEQCAVNIHGQEPGMIDARIPPIRGLGYISNATPGRHMVASASSTIEAQGGLASYSELNAPQDIADENERRSKIHVLGDSYKQVFSDAGLCLFGHSAGTRIPLVEFISAVTGWDFTAAEAIATGKRILTLRQAFNIRDGLKAADFVLPERMAQPATSGAAAGKVFDFGKLRTLYFMEMGWDSETGRPSERCLADHGLSELVGELP